MRATVERVPGSHRALVALERDQRQGGGLLAGALAFRLFAVMLPLALLITVGLGYAASLDRAAPADAGEAVGIGSAVLDSVAQSSKLSDSGRWLVAAFGLFALLIAAVGAARAVHAAHSLAWNGAVVKVTRPLGAGLVLIAAVAAVLVVWAAVNTVRANTGWAGLVVAVAAVVPFAAIWLGVSLTLPHGDAPWTALVPGAIVVGTGLQLVHLVTVLFVAGRVASASETYGPLGTAFAILGWLFLVSRVIVAGAMLNADHWSRRHPAQAP